MSLLNNPVVQREWVWAKRHWVAGVLLFLAALAINFVFQFASGLWWGRWGGFLSIYFWPLLAFAFRIPLYVTVWLVLAGMERERNTNGWEQLAATRLSVREILWGKLAVPIGYVWLLSLGLFVLVMILNILAQMSFVRQGAANTYEGWALLAAALPVALAEDFAYAVMAGLVAFRLGWRRSFAHGALRSLAALVGIGFGLGIASSIVQALGMAAYFASNGIQNLGAMAAVSLVCYNTPALILEALVVVKVSRNLETLMRSDLTGGQESRLG